MNYNIDHSIKFHDDVTSIKPQDIPEFDVLCAGFPCQPFSKAGMRLGFEDKGRGDLFYSLLPILDYHQEAKFVILENVRNLADNEANWEVIKKELMDRDFFITEESIILSPHQFGIPQIRERVYILGIRKKYRNIKTLHNGYIHREYLHIEDAWQRLYGELNMDDWPVTQAKDGFDWYNSGLEEKFINKLKEFTADFRRKADSIRVRERINSGDLVNETLKGFGSGFVDTECVKIINSDDAPSITTVITTPQDETTHLPKTI